MSEQEIAAQLGRALQQYKEAKKALGQSEGLLIETASDYEFAAKLLREASKKEFPPAIPTIIRQMPANTISGKTIPRVIDGEQAAALLTRHDDVLRAVSEARETLTRLGYGDIN